MESCLSAIGGFIVFLLEAAFMGAIIYCALLLWTYTEQKMNEKDDTETEIVYVLEDDGAVD